MQLTAQRCLVIPDVHQDIDWVERVLAQEAAEPWDRVVFLGDYFDTRTPLKMRTGVGSTCEYLEKLRRELGGRAVFLLGNHDVHRRGRPGSRASRVGVVETLSGARIFQRATPARLR